VHFFYIENDVEIFPAHYTWKVAEKGFKIAFMVNRYAMIDSCNIILENCFSKNHCEIQVRTSIVCALYSIKYGRNCLIINTTKVSQ
jgi:hypothetical protein